ncbi:hypothetical protein PP1_030135 [Pseudonocardia sp. P1]|nr:hypothetical protein Ae707Ps1_5853c [Pseudonocardia sp. Ae707_Ps1]
MYVESRRDGSGRRRAAHRVSASSSSYPWQVGLSAALWAVLGIVLIAGGTGVGSSSADPEQVEHITGSLGADTVASTVQQGPGVMWVIVGAAICIFAALLSFGLGWTRYVLMGIGASAVVVLALSAAWESLVAMAVLGVASVLLLAPRAHRYLS